MSLYDDGAYISMVADFDDWPACSAKVVLRLTSYAQASTKRATIRELLRFNPVFLESQFNMSHNQNIIAIFLKLEMFVR